MAADRAAATSTSSQDSPTGVLHRLVRTLSGKGDPRPAPQPISPALSSGTVPPSISESNETPALNFPTNSGPKAPSTSQKDLFSGVIDRLKSLSFGSGKSSGDEARKVRDAPNGVHPIIAAITSLEIPPEPTAIEAEPFPTDPHTDVAAEDPAEPTYLARKIQSLIDALPLPSTPRTPVPPKKQPKPPARDRAGKPIPPPGATPIKDSKLIAMLSSATIMNGGHVGERERRVSVWSVLDSLGSQRGDDGNDADDGPGGGEGEGGGSGDGGSVFQDTSGIMMYSPLFPTNDSLVEIAESGLVTPAAPPEEGSLAAAQLAGWMGMWPFSMWGPASTAAPAGAIASPVPSVTALPTSPQGSPYGPSSPFPPGTPRNLRMRIQGQRVWVPSTTKLSLQAMWWGYRLYLPPPVLDILDDKQLEATKRAALITTALTWFFSHIPLTALPPAVRPALLLLQTIIPFVGYIGTFISWSWGTIKSYDTGHGVILTATWLLPVALLPSTWEEHYFPPASPPEQAPTPLPPTPSTPPASPVPVPAPVPAPAPAPAPAPSPDPVPASPTSPPGSTAPAPAPSPTSPSPRVPAQPPAPVSPSSPPAPTLPSPPLSPSPQSPLQSPPAPPALGLGLVLAQPSDPLPPWVPPPPPPSPPKIPLPDLGEEEDEVSPFQSPRFGFGGLRDGGKGKSRSKGGSKGGGKAKEKEKEKGRARLKAMVTAPFAGKSG